MLIVNLYGAPGAGKSTGAAYIFSKLKMLGINAELVTEFAKDKVWEESKAVFQNQAYIFGKQYFRISRVDGKVDVVITDSPILLSAFYNNDPTLGDEFDAFVTKVSKSYDSMNLFINRVKPYNPAGRFQTEAESDKLAGDLRWFLSQHGVECEEFKGTIEDYDAIVGKIAKKCGFAKWRVWGGWSGNHDQRIEDATCTICGYRHPTVYGSLAKLGKYCPHCGNKMMGVEET